MALETPEWLGQRGGKLILANTRNAWFVLLNEQPLYSLATVPVHGQYACVIKQTNNGRRIESNGTYATVEDAIRAGLEDLRKAIGW